MLVKMLLPLAAALVCSTAVLAQTGGRVPADRQQIIEAHQRHAQAEIRRAWLASGQKLVSPDVMPAITLGKVPVKTFDVASQPASPTVVPTFTTGASGLSSIYAYFSSETSSQFLVVSYSTPPHAPPVTSGTISMRAGNGACYYYCGQFNEYSPAGKWHIGNLNICDNAGNCTYYSDPATLDTLFPTGRTIKLTNAGTPDNTAPLVTAGSILTPKVSLSSAYPDFIAKLTASDDRSGVRYLSVTVCPPSGASGICVATTTVPPSPAKNASGKVYDWLCASTSNDCSLTAKGIWAIYSFNVCDAVRNCVYDSDPADIQTLLGATTFKVVN